MTVPVPQMHDDEVPITDALVRDLLTTQCPEYAGRPLARLDTWGTDHVIYRLGDDLSVRLPKIGWAADQGELEGRWLPRFAQHLPEAVPGPVFHGATRLRPAGAGALHDARHPRSRDTLVVVVPPDGTHQVRWESLNSLHFPAPDGIAVIDIGASGPKGRPTIQVLGPGGEVVYDGPIGSMN